MLEILAEHPILGYLIYGLFTAMVGIVAYFIKRDIKNVDKRVDENTKDIKDVRDNYLDRFDKVEDKISVLSREMYTYHIDTMEKMSKMLAAVESQKEFCALVQEQKRVDKG